MNVYWVWLSSEDGIFGRPIEAATAKEAAVDFAKRRDRFEDYENNILNGAPVVVCVRDSDQRVSSFRVTGSLGATYEAAEVS